VSEKLAHVWQLARLKDVTVRPQRRRPGAEGSGTFTYVDVSAIDNRTNMVNRPRVVANREAPSRATYEIRSGDVLFSLVRPYLKNVARVPEELDGQVASSAFCVLRPAEVDSRYLFYAVLRDEFIESVVTYGHHSPSAREKEFLDLTIPVSPRDQQERIVDEIEQHWTRLDAAVQLTKSARRRLVDCKASLLQAAVLGRFSPGEGLGPSAESSTQSSAFHSLPKGWSWEPLGDLLADIEAGKSFRAEPRQARDDEWGVIKVSAMTWGEFRGYENKAVPKGRYVDPRYEIHEGDLLLSRANTVDYVGAVVLVGKTRPRLLLSDKSMRLMPVSGVSNRWLLLALSSRVVRNQLEPLATGTSDSMRNISQTKVRSLRIPLPPADEQESITTFVDRQLSLLRHLGEEITRCLRRAEAERGAILREAFLGGRSPVHL